VFQGRSQPFVLQNAGISTNPAYLNCKVRRHLPWPRPLR
jgi:hypothetical protein